MGTQPLILCLVSDLFFSPRIEDVARQLGYAVETIQRASEVGSGGDGPDLRRQFAEPMQGRVGAFVAMVVERQPALIIFDLNNSELPWAEWMAAVKSAPATRRIPALAFVRHTDVDAQARARAAGADVVLARSAFVESLPELIQRHARIPDRLAIEDACRGELSEKARAGLAHFNAGQYFEAHEELEHAWKDETGPARELYRAVLQVAVAYLQITRRNYKGAVKMFMRARQWLEPLPAHCRGVDVDRLRRDAAAVWTALDALGPQRMDEFDLGLLKNVVVR